ncbi:MAG: putative toxin-antitoxin system toxin component, PIN family [candidate division NC10 bacterium]
MIRAVLDANVIVSGVIRQAGPPGQLLKGALEAGKFTLVTSPSLLQEVAEALWEERIRRYHRWDQEQLLAFVARLHRHSQVTPGRLQVRVIADDPDDNAVLACAQEGNAAYIVTGDGHLLSLGTYEGINIVTPVQFLQALAEHQG